MTAEVFQNRWCHEEVLCSRPAESPSSEPRCLSQQAASLSPHRTLAVRCLRRLALAVIWRGSVRPTAG